MRGTLWGNSDIELRLTGEEFNRLTGMECEHMSEHMILRCRLRTGEDNVDSGRGVCLRYGNFENPGDGIKAEYSLGDGLYSVMVSARASELIWTRCFFGTRYGAGGEKITISLED